MKRWTNARREFASKVFPESHNSLPVLRDLIDSPGNQPQSSPKQCFLIRSPLNRMLESAADRKGTGVGP
jgi:hypothetical protein